MKHIINFSGGKDSTALLCWAKENLDEFTAIFCDTGWEHPLTYQYVDEIDRTFLDGQLVTIQSKKYHGFADLAVQRKIVPGLRSRFCTQELKIFPAHEYYESLDDEVTAYVGIRADESRARANMPKKQWVDDGGGYWMEFPLYDWTAEQCFALMEKHGLKPNPLYLLGSRRVGCAPCIMVSKRELRAMLTHTPEIKDNILALEEALNRGRPKEEWRAFFRGDYIPDRFCSIKVKTKRGDLVAVPTAQDVFEYLDRTNPEDPNQETLWDLPKCMSFYNLCE